MVHATVGNAVDTGSIPVPSFRIHLINSHFNLTVILRSLIAPSGIDRPRGHYGTCLSQAESATILGVSIAQ